MTNLFLLTIALAAGIACAAPLQRVAPAAFPPAIRAAAVTAPVEGRPTVGVAFGGGSARGIAHVGVIRWMEEHRIPIDVAAGTSMGGLIGGAFATGMDARELTGFIRSLDWDRLFGASPFAHTNIRRKADARAYPSRLEFGLRGGIVPPVALNSAEHVELLLGRITAPYFAVEDFDQLPTPFRTVAVDLLTAQPVVLHHGSLADALRATMSLPLVFPPVQVNGQVLIDGGTMNNVPADVVREMGAGRVIAINVGDLSDRDAVRRTMFGIGNDTLGALMRASSRRTLGVPDVIINVPPGDYGSLDWRRADELIDAGYRAAESMRAQLLPLAIGEVEYDAWRRVRQSRRRIDLPVPAFLELDGFAGADLARANRVMAPHVGVPLDADAVDRDVIALAALDRYETVTWRLVHHAGGAAGLRIHGRIKPYAPPFMMLGLNLENTTSNEFRVTAAARYLGFGNVGSGSELRVDGTVGSSPSLAIELFRPLGSTPFFVAPYAGIGKGTFNFTKTEAVVARYREKIARAGINAGIQLGAASDVRVGAFVGRRAASIAIGDPEFPELRGPEKGVVFEWRLDTQDSPVVPARGVSLRLQVSRLTNAPDLVAGDQVIDTDRRSTRLSGAASQFWSAGPRNRIFLYGEIGSSFNTTPLPDDEFALGSPFRLSAYRGGELRGRHTYVATGGYLRQVGRLPDFIGGAVFAGGWLENGDAVNAWGQASWKTNSGVGIVADTIVGPVMVSGSWSFDGRWRTYVGVGRLFR